MAFSNELVENLRGAGALMRQYRVIGLRAPGITPCPDVSFAPVRRSQFFSYNPGIETWVLGVAVNRRQVETPVRRGARLECHGGRRPHRLEIVAQWQDDG